MDNVKKKKMEIRTSGVRSSTELTASPPHASCSLSMFLLFARRRATMPSAASRSREGGSIPSNITILSDKETVRLSNHHTCAKYPLGIFLFVNTSAADKYEFNWWLHNFTQNHHILPKKFFLKSKCILPVAVIFLKNFYKGWPRT